MTEENASIERLRKMGHRITKVRRAVLESLTRSGQPRSAVELLAALETEDLAVNKTTIYRELDFLLENKMITELDFLDGMKRYELIQTDHHHHHLVCRTCQKIQCVEMDNDLDELEKRIRKTYHFKVESHVLEFFGKCSSCE